MKAKAGYPIIGSEVKVIHDNGEEVAQDGVDIGELIVRSHGVMLGYWKNEEATSRTLINGWLHTGIWPQSMKTVMWISLTAKRI